LPVNNGNGTLLGACIGNRIEALAIEKDIKNHKKQNEISSIA
jgi:hypothetical protein